MPLVCPNHYPYLLTRMPLERFQTRSFSRFVKESFDFGLGTIAINLDLKRGGNSGFLKTAAYGHFGRDDPDFAWEVVKPLNAKEDDPQPEMLRCCRYIRADKDID